MLPANREGYIAPPMAASRSRYAVIFFTVLIDLIGFGIIMPILPFYAQRFGASGLAYGAVLGVYSFMQFTATSLLGKLSDRVGRRPVLLATMLFNAVGYTLFAFAGSYWVLFLSRVVSGFAGGNISVAQAYMADITTPQERSRGMGIVGAAFGIGFSAGPAVGGLAQVGHISPGLVAVVLSLANFISAYFILPESLRHELRVKRRIFDLRHLSDAMSRPRLRPLMIVWALTPLGFAGYTAALPYRVIDALHWQQLQMTFLFIVIGVTAAAVQGFFFGKIVRHTGERALVIGGAFGMALTIAVIPLVTSSAVLYGWTFLLAVANSVFSPAATGLVSVYADPNEQGTVLGAAQSVSALGRTAGPPLIGTIYDVSPVTSFLLAGSFMALAGWVATRLARVTQHPPPSLTTTTPTVHAAPLPETPPEESLT